MNTYVCTLTLPNGNKIVGKARANSLDEEVEIEWSGATDRFDQIVHGKYSMRFVEWYLRARAQHEGGHFQSQNDECSPS
jgi:hypothetical protein